MSGDMCYMWQTWSHKENLFDKDDTELGAQKKKAAKLIKSTTSQANGDNCDDDSDVSMLSSDEDLELPVDGSESEVSDSNDEELVENMASSRTLSASTVNTFAPILVETQPLQHLSGPRRSNSSTKVPEHCLPTFNQADDRCAQVPLGTRSVLDFLDYSGLQLS